VAHAVLPLVGFGRAGASWLAQRGSTEGDVAWNALVAGAVLGYAIGDRVLQANVEDDDTRAQWRVGPGSVTWSTTFTGL